MIANIKKGSDFGGLLRYLLKENKQPTIIGGNMAGETTGELETEFMAFANLNQRVKKLVNHFSLAFAPQDGEVDNETKARIAEKIMEQMGYSNAQYLFVAHGREDPGHDSVHDHDHIHIVANAVDVDGKWVKDFQSFRRLEKILREIEKEEGLREIKSSWEVKKTAPSHGQTQRYKRELREVEAGTREIATLPVSDRLQTAIDLAGSESGTVVEFARKLAQAGITSRLKITRTGKIQGISYQMEGVAYPGNQLYDASLPKLQSVRGLKFNPLTDADIIASINLNPPKPIESPQPITFIAKDLAERIIVAKNKESEGNEIRIDDPLTIFFNPFSAEENNPVLSIKAYTALITEISEDVKNNIYDAAYTAYKIGSEFNLVVKTNSGGIPYILNKEILEMGLQHIFNKASENNITLVCNCGRTPCHGDVIKDFVIQKFAPAPAPTPTPTILDPTLELIPLELEMIFREPIIEVAETKLTPQPKSSEPIFRANLGRKTGGR